MWLDTYGRIGSLVVRLQRIFIAIVVLAQHLELLCMQNCLISGNKPARNLLSMMPSSLISASWAASLNLARKTRGCSCSPWYCRVYIDHTSLNSLFIRSQLIDDVRHLQSSPLIYIQVVPSFISSSPNFE